MFKTAKLATLVCATLCCATELAAEPGDFGRPRESVFVDEVLPWLKDGFEPFTGLRAGAPYTDDERTLRDLAYAILQPPNRAIGISSSPARISSIYGIAGSPGRRRSTCRVMPRT